MGLITVVAALVVGCQAGPQDPAPSDEVTDELSRLRDATGDENRLDVQPLADPEIAALLDDANRLEQSGNPNAARERLFQARTLAPSDPEVLQRLAELDLRRGELESAAANAMASFKSGPQVGRLCHRNWLTYAEASRRMGDEASWHQGMTRVESCQLKDRERL